ncbi:hypothetical protein PDG61_02315 [Mycolicibacterium sp. BiH015]|uniref:DUF6779 domain-containing protein n=1 Tax=Mycolicibacterium sp. BiH015 TaxID=3018808 RepID=UPI0022E3E077|nr:DUF6779 domain-containing protein [Mycolicibacterium sp. BiH015]MDA2889739.1 hypothetical protein [Mycolicibacterium sp. BiH015]
MIDPTRGGRLRRGGRRPGWILMTALLVLAIVASSALVFTNRVELLKLAVIIALWAAVIAAFVSVIYRRQSDSDQAKVRDLKLVYDLQLEREISARREYELSVESHLRRELASEIRAQSADEVAALRAELAALRANLEYLFDADLSHRPAIETERTAGRVSSSRIDTEDRDDNVEDHAPETDESPIIDVPAEPHPPEGGWAAQPADAGGAHRRAGEQAGGRRHRSEDAVQAQWAPPPPQAPTPTPPPQPARAEPQFPWLPLPPPTPPQPRPQEPAPAATQWQPVPAEGQWIPAGEPGSNWVAPANDASGEYVGRRRAPEQGPPPPPPTPEPPPAAAEPQPEPPRGRHYSGPEQQPQQELAESETEGGAHTGGQSVAELLARLQATPSGGGRRRRRGD